jgi:hypothetical protein
MTILTPEGIKYFDQMHRVLQGIRRPLIYAGPTALPGSFAVFEVQCPDNVLAQFDWQDSVATQTLYVRLGTRAILLSHDGGAQMLAVGDIIRRHQERALHPLQMEELAAKFLYKEVIRLRWPVFSMADDGSLFIACLDFDYAEAPTFVMTATTEGGDAGTRVSTVGVPHPNDDGRSLFGDWVREEYLLLLSRATKLPISILGGEGGTTATWLVTLDDEDLLMNLADHPY